MKNTIGKITAIICAILMFASLFTVLANADNPVASGKCGENASWALDNAGVLTITGTGEIRVADDTDEGGNDVVHFEGIPWYEHLNDIIKVNIAEGITAIGDSAFFRCSEMTEITIPSSVTVIKNNAFDTCEKLVSVAIPANVTSLGESVFHCCCSLKNVTLPEGLKAIPMAAFSFCSGLEEITLPESVETVDEMAFYWCPSLKTVNFGSNIKSIGDTAFYIPADEEDLAELREAYDAALANNEKYIDEEIPVKCFGDLFNSAAQLTVNYNGYEEDWGKVQVSEGNDRLKGAGFSFITERTAEDEATGIGFVYDSDEFGKDLAVTVNETEDEGVFALIDEKSGAEKVKAYNFAFTAGNAFPAGGRLTVKIPVPEGFSAADCKVYYVNPETGAFEDMNAVLEGGYLVFEVTHFSVFALVDESTVPEPEEEGFFAKVIAFFRMIIETIKGWFAGLGK